MVGLLTGTFLMYNTQSYPTTPPKEKDGERRKWREKALHRD
jgi:hypothetical protein